MNGDKTASQVTITGNVLTENSGTSAVINLTRTDSSLTGQIYAKDGSAITLNAAPAEGSAATVTGSGLADGTDSVMTVNADNTVLNGGYYALSGGTTTVTLTGNSVLTAPDTTSGFSAVLGSLPTRPTTVTMTCKGSTCSTTVTIGVSVRSVVGFITGNNMAGGAISGSSFTADTEAGTVVNGNLVAEDNSDMTLTIGGTLNGYADAWDGSTADITVSGVWNGNSTAYYIGKNTIALTGTWTGDADAYLGGTLTASIAEGAAWTGDALSEGDSSDGYGLLTVDLSGTWDGNAGTNYGGVLNATIESTGVWTGDAESTDSYADKASEVNVVNKGTWNGDAAADSSSLLTVNNTGSWTGDASASDTGSQVTITNAGTWSGSARADSGSAMTIDVSGEWTGDAAASDSGTTLTITDSGVWSGSAAAESGAAVTVSDLNEWTGDATAAGSGSTMDITNAGTWSGSAKTDSGSAMTIDVSGEWTGDAAASDSGTTLTITDSGVWSGSAAAESGAAVTVSDLNEWTGDAAAVGSGSTMDITNTGVWNGNASVSDSAVMTIGALQTWNGNATVSDSGSRLTVTLPGVWNGNASVSAGRMDLTLDGTWNGNASVTSNGVMTVDMNGTWNGNVSATAGSTAVLNIKGTWNGAVVEASEDSSVTVTDNTASNTGSEEATAENASESSSSTHGVLRFARLLAVNTASNDLTETTETTENTEEEESAAEPGVSVNFEGDSVSWNLTGDSELSGLSLGGGTVSFPTAVSGTAFTGTELTVNGDFTADGGTLRMNAELASDRAASDVLSIEGNASGIASITVTDANGSAAQTVDGIRLIEVKGESDAVFTMPEMKKGAFIYSLRKIGKDWYLTDLAVTPETAEGAAIPATSGLANHVIRPEIASYANNLYAANTMFAMKLSDRLGETAYSDAIRASGKKAGSFWIRTAGGHTRKVMADGENTTRGNWGLMQVGGDLISWPASGSHRFHVGLMAGYAHESNKTASNTADYSAKGKVSGFSGGVYATWMNSNPAGTGPYADAWLQYLRFKNTASVGNYAEEVTYHSKGFTGSLEAGYTFALKDWQNGAVSNATRLRLEGQLIRMGVRADNVLDSTGTSIQGIGAGNVRSRLGATLFHQFENTARGTAVKPYLTLNWIHDTKSFGTAMDGVSDTIDGSRNVGEVKAGVEAKVTKNVNLWGSVGYQGGTEGYRNVEALFGAKILF